MRGVLFEITLPEGAILSSGKIRTEAGQLEGRSKTPSSPTPWTTNASTADRAKYEWVVSGVSDGAKVTLVARHERAGVVRHTLRLG